MYYKYISHGESEIRSKLPLHSALSYQFVRIKFPHSEMITFEAESNTMDSLNNTRYLQAPNWELL